MRSSLYLLATCFLAVLTTHPFAAAQRQVENLDGTWNFATDPDDVGEAEKWYLPETPLPPMPREGYAAEANGTITVPGIWDNQGYGVENEFLRHNAPGKGWYRRQVEIPSEWAGRRVFLCIGGVQRYAKVWVDGHELGEHIGFLSDFEYELTEHVHPGQAAFIVIQVDSKQRWDVDAMYGAGNLADFMMVEWGGIWGHVTLEARAAAWLSDLYVQPDAAGERCTVSAVVNGEASAADTAKVEVFDQGGNAAATANAILSEGQTSAVIEVPDARLWSPEEPYLYTARVTLFKGSEALDSVEARFGMRDIAVDGHRLLLNGKPIFLAGYGDDHIYPKEMAFSADKQVHLERLRVIKSYGFNHVRHHSTIMPDEYYEACDEVGIMPTAEFPIVYGQFLPGDGDRWKQNVPEGASPEPARETYRKEWAAAIRRHRNHPSILCWVMGNELWTGMPLARDFQQIARELDPTRPFADTDGLFKGILEPSADRDTLDLYFLMFDVFNNPIDIPDKFVTEEPLKPVIAHEMGNYVTFTRTDVAQTFQDVIRPYWLVGAREKLEERGLLDEADAWALASERLYLLCHKYNTEALRKNPYITGHHWWLFQDYWTSSNGIVDFTFRPKPGIAPEDVRKIVSDVVLLEDGLPKTCRGGETLNLAVSVSNFSTADSTEASATVRVLLGGNAIQEESFALDQLAQGDVSELARLAVTLPDVDAPTSLILESTLDLGDKTYTNNWRARAFPAVVMPPSMALPIYASRGCMPYCEAYGAKPLPADAVLPESAVYVSEAFDERMVDAVERGARLVLLGDGSGVVQTRSAQFRTSWWKAGHNGSLEHLPVNFGSNHCGTYVYDHPVTRAMAPDNWCDDGWHLLIEGGHEFVLENAPAPPQVIVRALPGLAAFEDKALLFEVGVGQGVLVVSGLNHERAKGTPEHQWLMARLVEHAASMGRPASAWPGEMLRDRALPDGQYVQGFRRVVQNDCEEGQTRSYRGETVKQFICRQTETSKKLIWEADPPPANWTEEKAVFVFAGGFGWQSQPRTAGFRFWVNGEPALVFDTPKESAEWRSDDGNVAMRYVSKWNNGEDDAGLFYVTVARDRLSGEPTQFAVESLGDGSKRWFGLAPYVSLVLR